MGRKKKRSFINKKEARTYHLVSRSQQDPLAGDANESQYVLMSMHDKELLGEREGHRKDSIKEQQKHGIFYEDDYDYLQHIKPPTTSVLELVMSDPAERKEQDTEGGLMIQRKLPAAVFGTEVKVKGNMDRVLPITGPCPDWDPEVVEALDNAEICVETDSQLEDDFVMLANAGEPGLPVYVTNQLDDDTNGRGPWWTDRVDFDCAKPTLGRSSDFDEDDEDSNDLASTSSAVGSDTGNLQDDILEKKTARFTEYSMTSSVVPRSEALTLLDDHFEEFMVKYNDDQFGAGDEEVGWEDGKDGKVRQREYDQMLLQNAVEDFVKNFQADLHHDTGEGERGGKAGGGHGNFAEGNVTEKDEERKEENSDVASSEEGEEPPTRLELQETTAMKWDCESILRYFLSSTLQLPEKKGKHYTPIFGMIYGEGAKKHFHWCTGTYSNLYNHPTRITEPISVLRDHGKVRLSKKTGIPLGVIPGPSPKENLSPKVSLTRPKNEDKVEKKARKTELRDERKQRRLAKKANKVAFRSEALRQERYLLNNSVQATAI